MSVEHWNIILIGRYLLCTTSMYEYEYAFLFVHIYIYSDFDLLISPLRLNIPPRVVCTQQTEQYNMRAYAFYVRREKSGRRDAKYRHLFSNEIIINNLKR